VGIVGRLLLPSFLAAWVVSGLLAAGNLDIPLLMSASKRNTVPVRVYQLYTSANLSGAAALLVTYLSIFAVAVLAAVIVRLVLKVAMRGWSRHRQNWADAQRDRAAVYDLIADIQDVEPAASLRGER
jgi:iron(III) transport system permease protein